MAATLPPATFQPLVERTRPSTRREAAPRAASVATPLDTAAAAAHEPTAVGVAQRPEVDDGGRALVAIRSIVRALHINTRAMELRTGMSLAQVFVLQELARSPVDSLNDLAARTATHQSSVSVVVRRLAERGLVSRTASAGDHRRIEIAITDAGRELLAHVPTTVQAQLVGALSRLDDERRRSLAELLEEWLSHASIDLATPAMFGEDDAGR